VRQERVFIPWEGPSLNKIWAGMHWAKRKDIADTGHRACLVARGLKPFIGAVKITFQPVAGPRKRRYDCCNYALTNKVIVDGLVRMKVLTDDWIDNVKGTETLAAVRGERSGTWVAITEIGDYGAGHGERQA